MRGLDLGQLAVEVGKRPHDLDAPPSRGTADRGEATNEAGHESAPVSLATRYTVAEHAAAPSIMKS